MTAAEQGPRPEPVVWLAARGLHSDDHVSLCMDRGGRFSARVLSAGDAAQEVVEHLSVGVDTWISVNPMTPGTPGKGSAKDVAALVALWADLDIGAGKLPDYEHADRIIADLSHKLGTTPVSVTRSGHGLQPIWAVERVELTEQNRVEVARQVQRWGALVRQVCAQIAPAAKVDNVFNLDRILRVPGTQNMKQVTP